MSPRECEHWVRGIRFLTEDTIKTSYPLQVERWLRKEYYSFENMKGV